MESNVDKKDAKFQWELWDTKLKEDHRGVRWENGHHLWINWTKPYIESILKEPEVSIPWKWGYCKTPIISNYSLIQFSMKAV